MLSLVLFIYLFFILFIYLLFFLFLIHASVYVNFIWAIDYSITHVTCRTCVLRSLLCTEFMRTVVAVSKLGKGTG